MRTFVTFLSLFTLLFFLSPILCLSDTKTGGAASEFRETAALPERVLCGGESLSSGDFLVQCLAAADLRGYHREALKSAAVVAATRLRQALQSNTDLSSFDRLSPTDAKKAWGDYWFSQYWPLLEDAVEETWGQLLVSEEAEFSPAYFPLSWGMTAQGVECPYDFTAEGFEREISHPLTAVQRYFPDCKTLTVKKARTGRVESVTSGNTVLSGEQVAAAFGLPSLCFTVTVEDDRAVFRCKGMGSGEGMSLYAANEKAKRGADYTEILKTFYPEATLRR